MPTYEYACKACDQHVEVVQSFTDDPLTTCDACGGSLRKVIHASGILFKGSGFYSTDRRAARPQTKSHNKDGEKDSSPPAGESKKKESSDGKSTDKTSSSDSTVTKKAAEKTA